MIDRTGDERGWVQYDRIPKGVHVTSPGALNIMYWYEHGSVIIPVDLVYIRIMLNFISEKFVFELLPRRALCLSSGIEVEALVILKHVVGTV